MALAFGAVIAPAMSDAHKVQVLEEAMQAYGTRLMHLAYFYLKDRQLAEDVAQEVFWKAYQRLETFRGDSQFYTWLCTICINLCRTRTRSRWWQRQVPVAEHQEFLSGQHSPGADEEAMQAVSRAELFDLVMELPDSFREVVVLFYYQDLSLAQIAEVTSQKEATVKTHLYRARQKLKRCMAERALAETGTC